MDQEKLQKANELSSEIKSLESLDEHFNRFEDNRDAREEVSNILNSYDNLMSGVSRDEAAEIMLHAYATHIKGKLSRLRDEFSEL